MFSGQKYYLVVAAAFIDSVESAVSLHFVSIHFIWRIIKFLLLVWVLNCSKHTCAASRMMYNFVREKNICERDLGYSGRNIFLCFFICCSHLSFLFLLVSCKPSLAYYKKKFVQWLIFESMLKITVFGSVQIVKIRGVKRLLSNNFTGKEWEICDE